MPPTQHAGLSGERWAQFSRDQQILMIGNEMNRARSLFSGSHRARLAGCYERILALLDLTVAVQPKRTLRRELLRWRDLIAALYIAPAPSPEEHDAAFRCLLLFTPEAAKQIPLLLPRPPAP